MSLDGSADEFDDPGVPDAPEDDGLLDASDTLDEAIGDPLDAGYAPADRWSGANRFGTTAAEQRQGESLDQGLAEEEPDISADDPPRDSDEDELTRRGYERDPRAGRLLADDEGFGPDEEADLVGYDVGIDGAGASAEEAAVHVVDSPDDIGDGPLGDD